MVSMGAETRTHSFAPRKERETDWLTACLMGTQEAAEDAPLPASRGLVEGPDFQHFQRRFFTPTEVAQHNQLEDLWVSYLSSVYDLTPLAEAFKGKSVSKS